MKTTNVICFGCNTEFKKRDSQIRNHPKRTRHFCSKECFKKNTSASKIELKCTYCSKPFVRAKCDYLGGNCFCSRTCAAIYNNTIYIKRKRHTKTYKKCKICGNDCYRVDHCNDCIKKKLHYPGTLVTNERTIASMFKNGGVDANRYTYIRQHARKVTANRIKRCQKCRYSLHVETCHIKDIADFPLTATLGEVNHPDNLLLLCRNHHWELDHGYLKADEIGAVGFEPTT